MRPLLFGLLLTCGCAGVLVQPGHRALRFDPHAGGLQKKVLQPGYYSISCRPFSRACPYLDDFDITYSRRTEQLDVYSKEGVKLGLKLTLIYRPIVSELYELDSEIGHDFYDSLLRPELRSSTRVILSNRPYRDVVAHNGLLEDEIEADLRSRLTGKHVEVSAIIVEELSLPPELVPEREAARLKASLETELARENAEIEALRARQSSDRSATCECARAEPSSTTP